MSFQYGTTTSYGSVANATPATVTGNTLTNVSAAVISLLPSTTYHYRTKVVAGGQTYYGADKTFTTLAITSVEEFITEEWKVFPNPFSDEIRIEIPESEAREEVILYGMHGEEKFKGQFSGSNIPINLHALHPGIYQLLIKSGRHIWTERLMKK